MKVKKPVPFVFVLDALAELEPTTRPMFGCTAVYDGERILLVLRDKKTPAEDDGVWLATTPEHHKSLSAEFLSMRSISLFGPGVTGWQVLPADSGDFEEAALRACELILRRDPRIGKIPVRKKARGKAAAKRKGR